MNGVYRHYKGNYYMVIKTGTHTETGEEMVIYPSLLTPSEIWIRPYDMFNGYLEHEGKTVKRFTKID